MATDGSVFEPVPAWDRTPAFSTVRRGYDPTQVLAYLRSVEERVQILETRLRDAERERDETRRERDIAVESWNAARKEPYDSMAGRLADLMRNFDVEVEKLRGETESESGRILGEATGEAERIRQQTQRAEAEARGQAEHLVLQAREDADRIVQKAQEEADQIGSDLFAVYGSTLDELRAVRDRMQSALRDIEVVLDGRPDEEIVMIDDRAGGAQLEQWPAPSQETPSDLGR